MARLEDDSLNGAFVRGKPDTDGAPKKLTHRDRVYAILSKHGPKTFTKLQEELDIKSTGSLHTILAEFLRYNKIRKIKCKCCDSSDLYEVV